MQNLHVADEISMKSALKTLGATASVKSLKNRVQQLAEDSCRHVWTFVLMRSPPFPAMNYPLSLARTTRSDL